MSDPAKPSIWTSGLWAFIAAVMMLGWVAWENRTEDTAADRPAYGAIKNAASQAEANSLGRLAQEAYDVLRSEDLRRNLLALSARYPAIYARASDQAASAADIVEIVGLERPFARYAPAQVTLVDDLPNELAMAGEGPVSGRYSEVIIGRPVLRIFTASDVVARSCAINVAAHEYAHTISLTPMGYRVAFSDTGAGEAVIPGRQNRSTPVASYLIGSVAQCTWLVRQGRILRADVPRCVETFGVNAFNWDRCGQFAGGEPVAPRPGLAVAAPGL